MPRQPTDIGELVERTKGGDPRAVARLISLIEDESPLLREVAGLLGPLTGDAHIVGVTGAPGVGKSTTTSALVSELRRRGQRVGVLAVDPTSPFSGGALLGDRVRMQEHATDPEVFVRSMATRGQLGGLAAAAPQALRVLEAAGCAAVFVETVGVGQSEIEIAGLADSTVVLLAPGMGDGIQAAKAGILEVGDIYVVNKADRDGAEAVRRDLRAMLRPLDRPADAWKPPVLLASASAGEGIDAVAEKVAAHRAWLIDSDALLERRVRRARGEIEGIALERLRADVRGRDRAAELAHAVAVGETDAYTAADRLIAAVSGDAAI